VNVVLVADSAELQEVIVVTVQLKKDATGAVDQIGAEDFDNVASPSPAQLLRGKVAGVQVIKWSQEVVFQLEFVEILLFVQVMVHSSLLMECH
jgi:iron complex outermembrane receptor protein